MQTLTRTYEFDAPAPPERVFPLLCPVREHDWLVGWRCELLHSRSGVAEEDCIFRTELPETGPVTWVVSRHEPPKLIEFVCFAAHGYVMRLKISLSDAEAGSHVVWTRRWSALGPEGDRFVASLAAHDADPGMDARRAMLVHFLETGEMLRT